MVSTFYYFEANTQLIFISKFNNSYLFKQGPQGIQGEKGDIGVSGEKVQTFINLIFLKEEITNLILSNTARPKYHLGLLVNDRIKNR